MRIATYWWGGQRHVGRLSDDGARVTALACGERAREVGALALIEALADGRALPRTSGASLPLSAVQARRTDPRAAPQHLLLRRQLPCACSRVGGKRYRPPAGRRGARRAGEPALSGDLLQGGRLRRRSGRADPDARRRVGGDRLRSGTRGADRPPGAQHPGVARDGARVRLHDLQRRHRARRADAPPAVAARQVVRHVRADGAVHRRRRRTRRPEHARALLGQRRAAPGCLDARSHLRHPGADRRDLHRHHA